MIGNIRAIAVAVTVFCVHVEKVQAEESGLGPRVSALVEECKTNERGCEEYLLGVWDSALMLQALNDYSKVVFCPTTGPTGEQLRIIFNAWAKDADPEVLAKSPRVVGVILAEKHAFSCADVSQKKS